MSTSERVDRILGLLDNALETTGEANYDDGSLAPEGVCWRCADREAADGSDLCAPCLAWMRDEADEDPGSASDWHGYMARMRLEIEQEEGRVQLPAGLVEREPLLPPWLGPLATTTACYGPPVRQRSDHPASAHWSLHGGEVVIVVVDELAAPPLDPSPEAPLVCPCAFCTLSGGISIFSTTAAPEAQQPSLAYEPDPVTDRGPVQLYSVTVDDSPPVPVPAHLSYSNPDDFLPVNVDGVVVPPGQTQAFLWDPGLSRWIPDNRATDPPATVRESRPRPPQRCPRHGPLASGGYCPRCRR